MALEQSQSKPRYSFGCPQGATAGGAVLTHGACILPAAPTPPTRPALQVFAHQSGSSITIESSFRWPAKL